MKSLVPQRFRRSRVEGAAKPQVAPTSRCLVTWRTTGPLHVCPKPKGHTDSHFCVCGTGARNGDNPLVRQRDSITTIEEGIVALEKAMDRWRATVEEMKSIERQRD